MSGTCRSNKMTTTVHLAPPLADVLSGGCRVVMRTRDQRPKSLLHLIFDRLLCKLVRAGMVSPSSQSFSSSCQWMLDGRLLSLVCHHENSPSSLSLLIFFFLFYDSHAAGCGNAMIRCLGGRLERALAAPTEATAAAASASNRIEWIIRMNDHD